MKLSQFKFTLPQELVAQYPADYRDDARLLVLHRRTGAVEHRSIKNLVEYFSEGDTFVFNDTQVFPARLYATKEKTNALIEVFLLRELSHDNKYWDVLVDPARKIRIGNKLFFDDENTIVAEVVDNTTSRGRTLRFLSDYDPDEFRERLYALGLTPLPKYIHRPVAGKVADHYYTYFDIDPKSEGADAQLQRLVAEDDLERYQSIFASKIGAVAAPATALHFSKQLLKRLEIAGIIPTFMTVHINLGNFKSIDVEDLTKHKMDSEEFIVSAQTSEAINAARTSGHRICAVGTEVLRAMETVVGTHGDIPEYSGWTNKFIYPPYEFGSANAFIANFYMPESAQLMLTSAYAGHDYLMNAYKVAIKEKYRFGDYGDAMLIID